MYIFAIEYMSVLEQHEIEKALNDKLSEKLENLPTKPGVYQFKNINDKIIYVGKAKSLRSRVRSYFQQGRPVDAKTKAMITRIADVEVILVDSEAEALILEDTLIKKHKPKYNVLLRDDKSYPYVRVTHEQFPRVFPTRRVIKDGSKYFGPFTEVRVLRLVMKTLRSLFMIRSCDLNITDESIEKKKHKICLDYHIKKCEGPCEGLISEIKYNQNIKQAMRVLAGKTKDLEKELEEEMHSLSEEMKFEEAAIMRNRLNYLREYSAKQKVVSMESIDRDIFGLARLDELACTLVLKIREGKLIGKRHFIIKDANMQSDEKIIQRSVEKWYLEADFVPKEIYLPNDADDTEYLTDWLGKLRESSVKIIIPKIGEKRQFVEMAESNAKFILKEYLIAIERREQVVPRPVLSLQRDLRLSKQPRRIECFDNSHIQGSELVSSMVVFEDGKPKKSEYRKFKIKTVEKNDDFAAMREVITRRYTRMVDEEQEMPDLIIIDGGKGQLSAAYGILSELGIENLIPIIGLAKRLEEVFFPNRQDSVLLPKSSSSLKLIQQLRDEAHRFAITYHRKLRDKRTLQTELTEIEGIGEKTAQKLLTEFGSVANIKKLQEKELQKFLNTKQTKAIIDFYKIKSD